MPANYTTLEDVRKAFPGTWDADQENWDEWVVESIPVVSAILRRLYTPWGKNLDLLLLEEQVEEILVKMVANNMIIRMLKARETGMAGGIDYSNLSQTAGIYSQSFTTTGSTSSFYIKPSEMDMLAVPTIGTGSIEDNYIPREVYGNELLP